jgi:hypothetical protein
MPSGSSSSQRFRRIDPIAFNVHMNSRPTHIRLRIAILLGFLLVLGGAASTSAFSLSFPGAGRAAHGGDARGLTVGDQRSLDIPAAGGNPGETVTSRQVVVNDDRQTLRYALTSASGDHDRKGVRDILHVTIRTADRGSGSAATCEHFDGTLLYDGPLGATTAGFGDAAMGGHPGDRLLAPGQRETLCFEVTMPIETGNEYQGATTFTTWTIDAEQEAGNP